jgi:plastocyanin
MRRAIVTATALAVATAMLAMPATGIAGKTAKVKVNDDYYSPTKLSIKKKTKVKFSWNSSNINTHNVTMKSGPKGVKKSKQCASGPVTKCNKSASGSIGINFAPTFDKTGTYNFYCTVHPDLMKIKITVKK